MSKDLDDLIEKLGKLNTSEENWEALRQILRSILDSIKKKGK